MRQREHLLAEGLDILAASGPNGLTVDSLCRKLGCTKGSFYHHFRNRDDYVRHLLEFWVEEFTHKVIIETDKAAERKQRRELMLRNALAVPKGPESAIRAWAVRNPMVEEYTRRVDALRVDYLRRLFGLFTADETQALRLARATYTLFLGSRFISPPLDEAEYRAILDMITGDVGVHVSGTPETKRT